MILSSLVIVVRMTKLSDTMTKDTVLKWSKEVDDKLFNGDVLAEIETDKMVME